MANRQDVKVNLAFEAKTDAAIRNLNELGKILNKLATNTTIGINNGEIQQAVESAQQLQVHLQNAVNVDTGKIDLLKLNSSLKSSKTNLQTLTTRLQTLGPQGQQAFLKLAKAVSSAETPIVRLNKKVADLGKTLINTAKWQISSEVIHGITGMFSEALRHAEDLNAALTDIRIVTGLSAVDMANFAQEASFAAKALNTTSTEYAKAALIFYQQGLSGKAVTERTETVIKLAQATGQSAKIVSDQMTAIWNNFDNGTKSLEKYADVLTKLGAITAASTDEISEGLEKFAAVAQTVGLEYETAAAAVATVVDKTRQSADVVGTSFKTIFARMQNLELGETLEDGVNLTKYSKALEDVGVRVLDAQGQMRDMDDILNDLGKKWEGLGKTTQTAIAQTVGGIRQYNQMMALMNNWGDVQKNIEAAKESGGELAKQTVIWSESYEAAQERLTQAQNQLYENFVNDKVLIVFQDIFASLTSGFTNFTKSIGGALPLVLTFVGAFSKVLFPALRNGWREVTNNLAVMTGKAQKEIDAVQLTMRDEMLAKMTDPTASDAMKKQVELAYDLSMAKRNLAEASKYMSAAEHEEAEMRLEAMETMVSSTQETLAYYDKLNTQIEQMKSKTHPVEERKEVGTKAAIYHFEEDRGVKRAGLSEDKQASFDTQTQAIMGRVSGSETTQELEKQLKILETAEALAKQRDKSFAGDDVDVEKTKELINEYNKLTGNKYEDLRKTITATGKLTEEQREELEILRETVKVRKEMTANASLKTDSTTLTVGKTITDNAFEQYNQEMGESGKAVADKMSAKAVEALGATVDMTSHNVTMEASIENLEKLITTSEAYKNISTKLIVVQKDLTTINNKRKKAITEQQKAIEQEKIASDNLKKATENLNKAQKNAIKNPKEAAKALKEYKKAQSEVTKAKKATLIATKNVTKEEKAMSNTIKSLQTQMQALAEKYNISKDVLSNFNDALENISFSGDDADTNLEKVTTAIIDLSGAASNTGAGMDAVAENMTEMLKAAGMNSEDLDALITKLRELGQLSPELEDKLQQLKGSFDDVKKPTMTTGDILTSMTTGVASLAAGISGLVGGVTAMMNAFDEGNTPLETTMGLLTGLGATMPILISLSKIFFDEKTRENTANAIGNAIDAIKSALHKKKMKEAAEEIAIKKIETSEENLNTAAKISNLLANPVTWGIAALAIAAIIATTVALTNNTKAVELNTERLKEQNEAAQDKASQSEELINAWKTESETLDTLVFQYNRLTKGSEEALEISKKIRDQAPALIQTYVDFAKSLDTTSEAYGKLIGFIETMNEATAVGGDWGMEQFLAANAKAAIVTAEENERAQSDAADTALKTSISTLRGNTDVTIGADGTSMARTVSGTAKTETHGRRGTKTKKYAQKYWVQHKNGDWVQASFDEEQYAVQMLHQAFGTGDNLSAKATTYDIKLDTSTPENFIASYQKLLSAKQAIEQGLGAMPGALEASGVYSEVCNMLNEAEDEYETVLEAVGKKQEAAGIVAVTKQNQNSAKSITDIKSVTDYNAYIDELKTTYGTDAEGYQKALDYVNSQSFLDVYRDAAFRASGLSKKTGTDVVSAIEGFSDEELELFLEIDTNIYSTAEEITSEVARLKKEAEQNEIKLNITAADEVLDTLKENGMTEEDWNSIRTNENINWQLFEDDNSGIQDFNSFLKASYEDQKQYMERIRAYNQKALEDSLKEEIAMLEKSSEDMTLSEEARANNKKLLQQKYDELAVRQKMNDIEAEERRREAIEALGLEVEAVDELTKYLQENNTALANNSNLAENMAKGLLLLADSLGITTEDLMQFTTALSTSFNGDGDGIHNALKDLNDTAEETGISLEELVKLSSDLASVYGLTGKAAVELTQYMAEASSKYDIPLQEMQVHAQVLRGTYKDASGEVKLTIIEATKLAVANQRMNKGLRQLSSGWQNWKKTLTAANKNTADYVATINEMTPAIRELIGATEDFVLPEGFLDIKKNIELIESAAAGSTQAIQALGIAITKAQIEDMSILDTITTNAAGQSIAEVLLDGIEEFENQLKNLKVGEVLSLGDIGNDWITALNDMSKATQMSVDEMNAFLGQMGLSADVTVTNVETKMQVPKYETTEIVESVQDPNNDNITTYTKTSFTKQIGTVPVDATIPVATIGTEENPGTASIKYIGKDSPSTSSKSAGGSTSKPASSGKKDIAKRYRNNDKLLEDKDRALSTAESALDELYGNDRITKMKEINRLMAEENTLLEDRNKKIDDYLKKDENALNNAMSGLGLSVSYNEDGTIKNEEELLTSLQLKYDNAAKDYDDYKKAALDDDGVIDATEQAELERLAEIRDTIGKDVDAAVDALNKYNDTLKERYTTEEKIAENNRKIMAQNYEMYIGKLNSVIEKNNDELEIYDYYLSKIADDNTQLAEAAGYVSSKINVTKNSLGEYKNLFNDLTEAYAKKEIDDAQYAKGLNIVKEGVYAQLKALNSLDKEMLEYYGNTLAVAGEEIAKYTNKISGLTSVLQHYQTLLSIMGKESDYESMGIILQGIADTAEDAKVAAKAEYDMFAEQANAKKAAYEALENKDSAQAEALKKEWEAAEAAANEAQDRMLQTTADWAEAMKSVVENKLKGFAKTLEEQLTGGKSFDELNTSMERASSLQEEYLTSTNQLYETQKMIRTAQKAIDETSNQAAKQKLKAFQKETKELQSQGKLSKYELDIQQAQYDLLLAEIALKEAQSAKSTVRLQRDSEGNFGYVYTADSNKVADAEQKVADAQNALYNKQLDGANDYTQKYQQTLSEMYDNMTVLQEQYLNGEIATEAEYERKMLETKNYYYAKLQNYAELYGVAIEDTTTVTADAWSNEFTSMMNNTEAWQVNVTTYAGNCKSAFTEWSRTVAAIKKTTGEDLDGLQLKVSNITTESDKLVTALTKDGGVIDTQEKELDAVSKVTEAYGKQRDALKELIAEYEKADGGFLATITAYINGARNKVSTPPPSENDNKTGETTPPPVETEEEPTPPELETGKMVTLKDDRGGLKSGETYMVAGYDGYLKQVHLQVSPNQDKTVIVDKTDIVGFASGGYTGNWGPEGKLAVLHQKELILNSQDTENLLAAVETLHIILNTIDMYSTNAQIGGILSTPGYYGSEGDILEQHVTIEASFPGVQDRNEIEEAFNNLINRASQYANRY